MKLKSIFKKTPVIKPEVKETASQIKPEVPEGLLKRCNKCGKGIFTEDYKKNLYIEAAVVNGTRTWKILLVHVLPNMVTQMVVTAAADIGTMMLELASLSFLGFGAQPPTPEWGLMLNEGRQYLQTSPWLMAFPGMSILIVVAIFNLWSDSLRDVVDPKNQG